MSRRRGRAVMNVLGILLTGVAVYYLVASLLRGTREAGGLEELLRFDPLLFAASFALMLLHLMAAAWSWQLVCATAGHRLTYMQAFNVHFVAQVGKYIPGKVWGAVGKVGLSRRLGMSRTQTGHALMLETLFITSGSLVVALPLVPMAAGNLGVGPAMGVAAVAGLIAVVVLTAHPGALRKVLDWMTSLTGREFDIVEPGFGRVLRLMPVYVLVFLLQGAAFVLLAWSFGLRIPLIPGVFLLPTAVAVGFLAVFAPGGLGVREVSLVWLLAAVLPQPEPGLTSLLAIASRLWITLGEAIALVMALSAMGAAKHPLRMLRGLREESEEDSAQSGGM